MINIYPLKSRYGATARYFLASADEARMKRGRSADEARTRKGEKWAIWARVFLTANL